ncbi:hypothetical protein GCM10011585_25720 [Edaphobacter dinghuensis]|uniref:Uncharacterized protein n=1 Tax=Edaphobacter dinghuensis TaxID=1560005 RepID=A0A917HIW3_9BACT|nr:hypothetical protein GCM10011585_25720 [Edaphobacter dinghuensis]
MQISASLFLFLCAGYEIGGLTGFKGGGVVGKDAVTSYKAKYRGLSTSLRLHPNEQARRGPGNSGRDDVI